MSYILDALRRADSERERGTSPTLHSNPLPADRADDSGNAARLAPWLKRVAGLAGVLGLRVLGGLASHWLSGEAKAPPVVAAPLPAPTPQTLPAEIRKALPTLQANGAMYSDNPSNRMLIINGQVFHEGDKVSADLVLEQIGLKSAVLSFKGYRYRVNY